MKTLFFNLTIFASALNAQEAAKDQAAEGELRIFCEPMEESTGTCWYQKRVTYNLDGYKPLVIEEDMEKGVYPSGAKEIHKLAEARFLILGGYSTGGGMYTTVWTIISGQNGRLLIQDELEFTRARGIYADKALSSKGSFSVASPPLPYPEAEVHALYAWEIQLRGKRYDSDTIRTFVLTKPTGENSEMIVLQIDDKGFVPPKMKKAEQDGGGQPAIRPESK
jgi:hypothetical protein